MLAYKFAKSLPPTSAHKVDPTPSSNRWVTENSILFIGDVELGTEKAIGGDSELQRVWFALLANDDNVEDRLARKVIGRCGRIYDSRQLSPKKYFRINKYPRNLLK